MSIDQLHQKIRKTKLPLAIDLNLKPDCIPQWLIDKEGSYMKAYSRFCDDLLTGIRGTVPAVRFSFGGFALQGDGGLHLLSILLKQASSKGFYVMLDAPEILSPLDAENIAEIFFKSDSEFYCDGIVISPYIGSDALKPFLMRCKELRKNIFVAVRTPNKSASEIQDLMTGTRLVHIAAADLTKRNGENLIGQCGYSEICALVSAGAPESVRNLRLKYNRMFLLVDGLDYSGANAKNCSYAFDQFGYGAIVCAGASVTAAWRGHNAEKDYICAALQEIDRIKRNISRYVTIL